jgi:hypothetical protein
MIEIMPESQGSVLGIKLRGKFTPRDFRDLLLPRLESFLLAQSNARLLFCLAGDLQDFDYPAILQAIRSGQGPTDHVARVAVVGASGGLAWALKIGAALLQDRVRTFPRNELEEAWRWIKS